MVEYPKANIRRKESSASPLSDQPGSMGWKWFVVGRMLVVVNNGHDGDYWACNNVRIGGAGAVGCRIDFDQEVADEIKTLYSIWKS